MKKVKVFSKRKTQTINIDNGMVITTGKGGDGGRRGSRGIKGDGRGLDLGW